MEELTVMIVDDEIMAIEYLKEMVAWEESGFRVVATATDAQEALNLFHRFRPRIIISDIRMPGMNGLDFCNTIKSLDDAAKVILLTAYKEFDFAKKAIEMGVSGYLVKHEISSETILAELAKVRRELENEAKARRIMNRNTLREMLEGDFDFTRLRNGSAKFLEGKKGQFALLLFKMDEPYPFAGMAQDNLPHSAAEQLGQWLARLPQEIEVVEFLKLPNPIWVFLFSQQIHGESEFWNQFYQLAAGLQEFFREATGTSYSGAAALAGARAENLPALYQEAYHLLKIVPYLGKEKIIRKQDLITGKPTQILLQNPEQVFQQIGAALNELDVVKVEEGLEILFAQFLIPSRNIDSLRSCCEELLRLLNKWRRTNCLVAEEDLSAESEALVTCYTVGEIQNTIRQIFKKEIAKYTDLKYHCYSKKVRKAIQYLQEHYSQDITVLDVAGALEMSDSHLSRMFKAETGQTILEYLTVIRIETAKKLLAGNNWKIYEVAVKVGYKTSQYFSQVFVRMTGMNPAEYRERQ